MQRGTWVSKVGVGVACSAVPKLGKSLFVFCFVFRLGLSEGHMGNSAADLMSSLTLKIYL